MALGHEQGVPTILTFAGTRQKIGKLEASHSNYCYIFCLILHQNSAGTCQEAYRLRMPLTGTLLAGLLHSSPIKTRQGTLLAGLPHSSPIKTRQGALLAGLPHSFPIRARQGTLLVGLPHSYPIKTRQGTLLAGLPHSSPVKTRQTNIENYNGDEFEKRRHYSWECEGFTNKIAKQV